MRAYTQIFRELPTKTLRKQVSLRPQQRRANQRMKEVKNLTPMRSLTTKELMLSARSKMSLMKKEKSQKKSSNLELARKNQI